MNILDIACILVSITGSIASFLSLKWVLIKREPKEEKDEGRIRRLNIYFLFMTLITAMLSVMMRTLPFDPGTAPFTSSMSFSASAFTTVRF